MRTTATEIQGRGAALRSPASDVVNRRILATGTRWWQSSQRTTQGREDMHMRRCMVVGGSRRREAEQRRGRHADAHVEDGRNEAEEAGGRRARSGQSVGIADGGLGRTRGTGSRRRKTEGGRSRVRSWRSWRQARAVDGRTHGRSCARRPDPAEESGDQRR
jgi:hypothetical protein